MLLHTLQNDKLIHPPKWLADNTQLLVACGSVAYGMSGDMSDVDVYGFAFAPQNVTFPHLGGAVAGFGRGAPARFDQWTEHHVKTLDKSREYDLTVYNIVKWFQMALLASPNIIDALFVPQRCVLHITQVGQMVRDSRHLFLSKEVYPKLRGYAYSQLKKVKEKKQSANPKRADSIGRHGYDVKASSHIVRLLLQCEQILAENTLDLERNSEILKSVRRGVDDGWTFDRIEGFFESKEPMLDALYGKSTLPAQSDEDAVKALLMRCLEQHYGSLEKAVVQPTDAAKILAEMQAVIDRHSRGL